MNHLQGLDIKVISEWPSLKNFNRKGNTMKYMTNQIMQRFMSQMAKELSIIQYNRAMIQYDIVYEAKECGKSSKTLRDHRDLLRDMYTHRSTIQQRVKRGFVGHRTLQKMEKVITRWINYSQEDLKYIYEEYLENRYDTFYRNRTKQAKQKLAKLVELQQAIRKQKRITRN